MFIRANGSICTSGQHRASHPSADAAVTGGSGLSDDAYLNMLNGTNLHILEHELGHGW